MNRFSIKDIETITGIKAHTLRIWEQRYNIVEPKRTETNIRYYDGEDLRFLLNISLLNKMGHKISKISLLNTEEIQKMVNDYGEQLSDSQEKLNKLVRCTLELDESTFEQIVSIEILEHGMIHAMTDLLFPFLRQIGILWSAGTINPAYEHFISSLITAKLLIAIDGLGPAVGVEGKKKVLLFLPEEETHEIGLLFAKYIFKYFKFNILYLGQNLPSKELKPIIHNYNPDIIFTSMISGHDNEKIKNTLKLLCDLSKNSKILVTGTTFLNSGLKFDSRIHPIVDYESLKPHL